MKKKSESTPKLTAEQAPLLEQLKCTNNCGTHASGSASTGCYKMKEMVDKWTGAFLHLLWQWEQPILMPACFLFWDFKNGWRTADIVMGSRTRIPFLEWFCRLNALIRVRCSWCQVFQFLGINVRLLYSPPLLQDNSPPHCAPESSWIACWETSTTCSWWRLTRSTSCNPAFSWLAIFLLGWLVRIVIWKKSQIVAV